MIISAKPEFRFAGMFKVAKFILTSPKCLFVEKWLSQHSKSKKVPTTSVFQLKVLRCLCLLPRTFLFNELFVQSELFDLIRSKSQFRVDNTKILAKEYTGTQTGFDV